MKLKSHFRHFLEADPERLHFAAHSHHLWPDVTLEAQERCWRDAARLADRKWDTIFGELYPETQSQVAALLSLPEPATLAFGPNTHGFVLRLLSCLPSDRAIRVLTTDSEFHSFERQMTRLKEDAVVEMTRIHTEPFESFSERFEVAAKASDFDLIYFSHVFYNSGFTVPNLVALVQAMSGREAMVAVDGYHGFMALETDLSAIADQAFYLSGGYKYAMAGEGACFMHCPSGVATRPRDTGWFAAFEALEDFAEGKTAYSPKGARFLGATFDPVGLYRLNAVLSWLDGLDLSVTKIHEHVHGLQREFIEGLQNLGKAALQSDQLVVPLSCESRGNFLTFRTEDAGGLYRRLLAANIVTDCRGDRLRFGFGLYHEREDIERLLESLAGILD